MPLPSPVSESVVAPRPPHSHLRTTRLPVFYYGADVYPEHWPEDLLAEDVRRMRAAGVNVVRMAEFAWTLMEPRPGIYRFELFERAVAAFGAAGIATILCTPTAAAPRWLTHHHPEVLRVNDQGIRFEHGGRVHASYSSPLLRERSRLITRAMAEHFRDHPHVVGWQTDNEFLCGFSEDHSEAARSGFQAWLRRRYRDDIAALNEAWGTVFWSQTYADFAEIPTPLARPAGPGPSHRLDFARFLSDEIVAFQGEQVDILRAVNPRWWITHNGCFPGLDYRGEFGRQLDVLGYDSYPLFDHSPAERPASHAFNLDRTRAWTGNFIVLEQHAGLSGNGWRATDTPEPGELRRFTYANIAHGADGILFFNWRTCPFGHEMHWCGVLDTDNVPRRRYREFARIGEELSRVGPAVLGTAVRVDVAVAASDLEVQAGEEAHPLCLPTSLKMAEVVHRWFHRQGYAVGCVHPADTLDGLALYVLPHWTIFRPEWVPALEAFAAQGGTLVIGARSATRDARNQFARGTLPGALRALAGVRVEEFGRRNAPDERHLELRFAGDGATVDAGPWYEQLLPDPDVEVLARWEGRHLDGEAAMTLRRCGKGQVIYVGAYLGREQCEVILPRLVARTALAPAWPGLPSGVECVRREGAGRRLWFFLNHHDTAVDLPSVPAGRELTGDRLVAGQLRLAPHDVAIIATTDGSPA